MLENFQGDSWSSIPPLHMPSLLPHDLCHGRNSCSRHPCPSPTPWDYLPSYPLLSPSPPASFFPSIRVFSIESVLLNRWPKYWSFSFSISPSNEHSGLISFRMDLLDLLAVQRDSQESFSIPQFKSMNSLVLSFLYSPTLTSIHDHWKNHSFDWKLSTDMYLSGLGPSDSMQIQTQTRQKFLVTGQNRPRLQ